MSERTATLRILLADDHVTVRHGLKLLIDTQPDMKVISEASDGKAAMQNALALKPDVIVMDISMPGLNGLELIAVCRELLPDLKTVLISGTAKIDELRSEVVQPDAFLAKPFLANDLLDIVSRLSKG